MGYKAASVLLISVSLAGALTAAVQTRAKPQAKKSWPLPLEDRLRVRLDLHPHDAAAHKQLVKLLGKKNAFRALVAEDANWVKNNPTDYFALIELVSYAKVALRDPEFAIAQQRFFLTRASRADDDLDYDRAMGSLAADLDKRGRPQEALSLLDQLVRLNPEDAGLWADRSAPLISLGRITEAIQCLRRSNDLDASSEAVHEALADALTKSGDLSGAEAEYRAALSVYQAKYKKGETTSSFDSLVKGLVRAEAAYQAEHSLAQTHLKLARVLVLEKKWDAAVAETQAALNADKTAFGALYLRAQIYDAAGSHDEAMKSRQTAQSAIEKLAKESSHPNGDGAVDPRLLFLSEGLSDSELGVAFPSEIVSILEPRIASLSPMERIMLAEAYFELGRIQDGKQQWESGISADPEFDNAVAHANLGQRLLKAGALRDSLPHLRRAYELDPQNMTYRMDYEATKQTLERRPSP